jgi:DNA primase
MMRHIPFLHKPCHLRPLHFVQNLLTVCCKLQAHPGKMISPNTIQQILSRIDIVEIVGSFVKLKKRGTNYLGLCPFHNEKSPSFTVSPAKEIYKCFGCGRSGNSISFLMEAEKYSYVEALRWLAAKYNVEIEETETSPEVKIQQQVADSLYIINNFAQQFFSNVLFNTAEGQDIALSYLKQRGFREDIIKKFQLGFNPEGRDTFTKAALAAQYNIDYLQKSGLVNQRDGNSFDNYRGRIIFPVHNQSGKVLGFGARIIKKNDKAPKYINTPENEIYVKSKILYGSYFARQAIDKADECLLVEGYTDVISLHQAGIENVVASGGTSLTPDQLRLVKKYTNNLTIIYDGDKAGIKAAFRGLDLALEESLNVKLVLIPDGEDPDSYVNKVGAAAFKEFVLANKQDVVLFQLGIALEDAGGDSVKKSAVVSQVAETISKINKTEDFTKQQDYIKQSAEILKIEERGLHELVNKFIREKVTQDQNRFQKQEAQQAAEVPEAERSDFSDEVFSVLFQEEIIERAVLRIVLNHGTREWKDGEKVIDYIMKELVDNQVSELDDVFDNKLIPAIIAEYRRRSSTDPNLSIKDFVYSEDKDVARLVIESTSQSYEISKKWSEEGTGKVDQRIFRLSYEDFMKEVIHNEDPNNAIYIHHIDDLYYEEVEDVLVYLKLRKLKKLILLNEKDMEDPKAPDMMTFIESHMYLKSQHMELAKRKKIVYFPF